MPVLKLDKDDPQKELEFEVQWQLSLTTDQRFEMMWGHEALEWLRLAKKHEHQETPLVIKRT